MRVWGIVSLVLLAGFVSAAEDEGRAKYEEHERKGMAIVKGGEGFLSIEDAQRAAHEFELSGRAAAAAGLYTEAVEVFRHRRTLLEKVEDELGQLRTCQEILEVQKKMEGPEAERERLLTLLDIGVFHNRTGNPALATQMFRDCILWFGKRGDSLGVAEAQIRLADASRCCGQFAAALRAADAAFPVIKAGKDKEEYLGAINVLAMIHRRLGNLDRAEKLLDEGLRLTVEEHPLYRAEYLLSIGAIERMSGRRKDAELHFHQAFDLLFRHGRYVQASQALIYLGWVKATTREFDSTITHATVAWFMGRADPYIVCQADIAVGEAHLGLGNLVRAREEFESGLAMAQHIRDSNQIGWAESCLAEVSLREEKPAEAADHVRRALASVEGAIHGLTPISAVYARPEMEYLGDRAVRAAFASKDPAITFELLERTRSCTLVTSLGGEQALQGHRIGAKDRAALRDAGAAIASLHRRLRFAAGANNLRMACEYTESLRKAHDDYRTVADRVLGGFRSAIGNGSAGPVSLADARASLRPDEAIVLYGIGGGVVHAMVVRQGGTSCHELGPLAEVEGRIGAVVSAMTANGKNPPIDALRKQILDPLELGSEIQRVLVSPQGALATTPFAALDHDREFAFIPSATSRTLLAEEKAKPGKRVLAIGNPVYSEERKESYAQLHRGAGRLHGLKNSLGEIMEATRETDERLVGAQATEARFRETIRTERRWRVIHFSCHGVVDIRQPAWSALALTPEGMDDGYLAVAEILTMRIPADLAVLSACSTGVGRTYQGEGLIALPGAFLHAGTPRVIASLWDVEDKAARAMMTEFYKFWRPKDGSPGLPAAKALRLAQKALREGEYPEPRHWAAWVLWGLPD